MIPIEFIFISYGHQTSINDTLCKCNLGFEELIKEFKFTIYLLSKALKLTTDTVDKIHTSFTSDSLSSLYFTNTVFYCSK